MTVFMVERELGEISLDDLAAAKEAAMRQADLMSEAGTSIRYLRSVFLPGEGRCMCLFEAASEGDVVKLNREAGIPFNRVVPAYDLVP